MRWWSVAWSPPRRADHNNWEAYNLSKHGLKYQRDKEHWNFNIPIKEAMAGQADMQLHQMVFGHFKQAQLIGWLKEKLELQSRVAKLEDQVKHGLLDLESETGKLSLGGLGGGLLLAGTMAIAGWWRSGRKER